MAGARVSFLKSGFTHVSQTYSSSMNLTNLTNQTINVKIPSSISRFLSTNTNSRIAPFQSLVDKRRYRCEPVSSFPRKCLQNNGLLKLNSWNSIHPLFASSTYRAYSSFFGGKSRDVPRETEYSAASFLNGSDGDTGNVIDRDWVGDLKNSWQSVQDTVVYVGDKAKKASDELFPYAHQLFDSHPYLHNVIIPVSGTLTGTLLAWMVLPRVLRKLHKYSLQGSAALLSGNISDELYPYEKSVWGALEYPVRYLVTFMAFTYLGFMIAPSTITSQYVTEAWRGGVVIAFIAFLYRWKSNYFSRALASQVVVGLDREKLLALDKISSVGLIVLGLMALAEACGVAVQSILTVGGVGGVATAFAARDILGNMLSGLSMQFSKPFSLGDTIKAGSVEGKVVDMGLTTTSLLSVERFPVIVPNSLFSSQVIVNKSRAQWRAILTKIPLRIDSFEKIPQISEDIKSMLRSNTKIFLGQELPYCYLSRVENSFAELTIGYNLKQMRKDEFYSAQQDILLEATKVINQHGATLGSTQQDSAYQ